MNPSETLDMHLRLGIELGASNEEIKKAYREKALYWHPDKNSEIRKKAHLEFIAISEAFEILYNKNKVDYKEKPSRKKQRTYTYYEELFREIFGENTYMFSTILSQTLDLELLLEIFKKEY